MEVIQVPPFFGILNELNVSKSNVLFDFLIARGNAGKPVHYQGRWSKCIDTRITSVKHILFILAVKFTWTTCFNLV